MNRSSRPASLPLIRTWEEGVVIRQDGNLYVENAHGQRFLIRKRHAEGLSRGDLVMFVPGRTTAIQVSTV